MTMNKTEILAAVLAMAFFLTWAGKGDHNISKDGEWHIDYATALSPSPVVTSDGSKPGAFMTRWTGSAWEYRPLNQAEFEENLKRLAGLPQP